MKQLMSKILLFACLVLAGLTPQFTYAQKAISGKVISSANNQGVPGATILVKGKTNGVSSTADGSFTINSNAGDILVVSGVGIKSLEYKVTSSAVQIISVDVDTKELNEVVVTALGIKKETKRLGYAVQEIKGSELVKAREPNPINGLVGKIAGLDVAINQELLGAPAVSLRGGNISLYVVDGMPITSDTWNISPDDIETYTVLKGLAATAIYGSRAQNGAILITTKKGTKNNKGYSIEFNSSNQINKGFLALPKTQDLYGGGEKAQYAFGDGRGGGINDGDYDVWGPKFEGQLIPQYDSPIDPVTGIRQGTPYIARGKDNLKRFVQAGLLTTNNFSLSSTTDRSSIRLSMSQTYQRGIIPNTKLNTANFNLNASYNLTSKLKLEGSLNYNRQFTPNIPDVAYGPQSYIYNMTIWTGADWDVMAPDIRAMWQPGKVGTQQMFAEYQRYSNPWFTSKYWLHGHYKNDVFGTAALTYKVSPSVEAILRANISTNDVMRNEKMPYSVTPYNRGLRRGDYREDKRSLFDNNIEGLVKYNKNFGHGIVVDAFGGVNARNFSYNSSYVTTDYLNIPELYTFSNSLFPLIASNYAANMLVLSSYYSVNVDLNKYLSISTQGRLDKNSAQPTGSNSFFYPSVSLASVISDYVKLPEAISFLKVRASYAQVKSPSTSPYIGPSSYPIGYGTPYVSTYGGPSFALSNPAYTIGYYYNNATGASAPTNALDPNTQTSQTSSKEYGLDVKFLKNRLSFSATYFSNILGPNVRDFPLSQTTGLTGFTTNAIKTQISGAELSLSGTPIQSKNGLNWNVLVNWSTYKEIFKDLPSNFENYQFHQGDRVDKLYAGVTAKTPDGQVINDGSGYPVYLPKAQYIGNADVKWSWSVFNRFSYKSFSLGFQFDGKVGGLVQDRVLRKCIEGGRSIYTATGKVGEARDYEFHHYADPGFEGSYIGEGVQISNGAQIQYDDVTGVIKNYNELQFQPNASKVLYIQDYVSSFFNDAEHTSVAKTYAKLREVVISYSLPTKYFAKTLISRIDVSLVGRNLLYFFPSKFKDMDVDQYSGRDIFSGNSREYNLQSPTTRSYGFNVNVVF